MTAIKEQPLLIGVESVRDALVETLEKSQQFPNELNASEIKQRLYVASYLEHRIENLIELFTEMIENHEKGE